MQQLQERDYRPPFITEANETVKDDCTVCSTLMATASATLGETVSGKDWRPLKNAELKALRERIRNHLPASKQTGGTSMADMRVAFAAEYPWLPQIPFYDEQDNTWDNVVDGLLSRNKVYVSQGNPALVTNKNSRLRRWTYNDNYGHAVLFEHAIKKNGQVLFYVMDPLGHGDYDGEYVPAKECKQYTWTFDGGIHVKATAFPRGGWSRAARQNATLIEKVRRVSDDLSDAKRAVANITARLEASRKSEQAAEKAKEAAVNAANAAETARAACQIALGDLQAEYDRVKTAVIDPLNAQVAQLTEQVTTLQAQVDALSQEKQSIESAFATCQQTVVSLQNKVTEKNKTIYNLRKKLS